MAVETGLTKQAYGITFTTRTADSGDWINVASSTYFYDIATDLCYYKDGSGTVKGIFDGVASNLYTADGTLTGARTVTMGGNALEFDGGQTVFKGDGFTLAKLLSTSGTNTSAAQLQVVNSSGTKLADVIVWDSANGVTTNRNKAFFESQGTDALVINQVGGTGNPIYFHAGGTTFTPSNVAMNIVSGKVGIGLGDTAAISPLQVEGEFVLGRFKSNSATNTAYGMLKVSNSSSIDADVVVWDSASGTTSNQNKAFFQSQGSSALVINSIGGTGNPILFHAGSTTYSASSVTMNVINSKVSIGLGETEGSAKLHVKGSGSTSGTTALLVQNSTSTDLLKLKDDGAMEMGGYAGDAYSLLQLKVNVNNDSAIRVYNNSNALGVSVKAFSTTGGQLNILTDTAGVSWVFNGVGESSYNGAGDFKINTTGRVTVGHNNPLAKFHIVSGTGVDAFRAETSTGAVVKMDSSGFWQVRGANTSSSTLCAEFTDLASSPILQVRNDKAIGMYGVTPVVQATTGIAPSVVSPGAGTNVLQDDTFDGYTVAQIVKALRNLGILA